MASFNNNERPAPDGVLVDIADYVLSYRVDSALAYETARNCLIDTLGCGLEALEYPACTKLLGPVVPGTVVPNGARVPGTPYQLDPVQAAFNLGTMIRWLDFNDCWLAAEWGHPSDNLGGILAVADWLSRTAVAAGRAPLSMRDVLTAMIKAHEIQGCWRWRTPSTRSASTMSSGQGRLDRGGGGPARAQPRRDRQCAVAGLRRRPCARTYRHAPNAGSRKSWAAGDATSRAVKLALIAQTGEMGYPSALTAKTWGFYDASFRGQSFKFQRPYGSYVMEHVLFKISYPAEFHSQTAVEAAMSVQEQLRATGRSSDDIASIRIRTHEACIRIIDKSGPLHNPADRDHTIQYMVAVPLIFGRLTASDYEDDVAADPRIDALRDKIECVEDPAFTRDYHDPDKRSIANGMTVTLKDGTVLPELVVEYPIGHKRRRADGIPLLEAKFRTNLARRFVEKRQHQILDVSLNQAKLEAMPVHDYVDLYCS